MRITQLKIALSLLMVCFMLSLSAQLEDRIIEEVNGKRYYVHKVEKGHSLYAIAKLYQSDVNTIIASNPAAAEGLSIGQRLRIPIETDDRGDMWENPIRIEDSHLVHRVKRRETLYAISKEYNADMNEILELNPAANGGLKRGMELLIPVNDLEATFLPERKPDENTNQKYHNVELKETVYSISRKYGVSVDELIQANGGLPEGLKAGARIVIPVMPRENVNQRAGIDEPTLIDANFKLVLKDKSIYKSKYKVALLLPFYTGYEDSANFNIGKQRLQQIAVEFYRGTLAGMDSLKQQGLTAELIVKDVHSGTLDVNGILRSLEAEGVSLVIGPLQRGVFEKVAKYFKGSSTHVVCPVKQNNKVLLYHENLSKVVPSNVSQMDALAEYIVSNHRKENVVFINSTFAKDTRNVQLFRSSFNSYTSRPDSLSALKELTVAKNKTIQGFEGSLSTIKKNIIVAPTTNEVVVADLMRRLMQLPDGMYDIEVFGLDTWRGFYETVNMEAREKYHIHMPSSSNIDEGSDQSKNFGLEYKYKYNVQPGKYAYLGYDISRFYGMGLLRYGLYFPNHFAEIDQTQLLQNHFDFVKTGVEAGYENRYVYLLAYKDYELKAVR